jgi:hypothetical protein
VALLACTTGISIANFIILFLSNRYKGRGLGSYSQFYLLP